MICLGIGGFVVERMKQAGTWETGLDGAAQELVLREVEEHGKFNFKLAKPVGEWRQIPSTKTLPSAAFAYMATTPERYLACVAEENPQLARDELKEIGLARMAALSDRSEIISTETEVRGGLTFTRVRLKLEGIQGTKAALFYDSWYACTEKYAYQFMFWSLLPQRTRLSREAEKWMDTFSLIKPDAESKGADTLTDGGFPAEGYETTLGAAGWKADAVEEFPEAQLRARKAGDRLALVSLRLPEGLQLKPADIDERMLGTMKVSAEDKLKGPEEMTHHGVPGRRYRFARKHEGLMLDFEVRVLQEADMVWMLVTWGSQATPDAVRKGAADLVRVFQPKEGPAVSSPGAVVRERAMILNDLGIVCYKMQEYQKAERLFRAAHQQQPGDAAVAGNVIDALQQMGKQDAVLTTLKSMMAAGPLAELPAMKVREAQALGLTGDTDKAVEVWDELFGGGYANEDHFLEWINLLIAGGREKEALVAVEKYGKANPSPRVTRWHASVLGRNGRWEEAFAALAPVLNGESPDLDALYLQGEMENDAGRYEAAEKTVRRLTSKGGEGLRSYMILGWSEWHRKHWKAAREAFEKAAEKAPESPIVKEALAMTAGAMGQGTAEVSRTPLEPVPLPGEVRELIAAQPAPPESLIKGHGAILLERHTGCYFESGKSSRVTQTYRIKVLDNAGVEAFSTLAMTFYPSSEKIHVNSLTVRDESGKLVQEGSTADAYTTAESGDLATGAQVLRVPVPGLRRGCTVEASITVEDKARSTKAPFRRDLLVSGFPALARVWYFTGNPESWKFATSPGLRETKGKDFKSFVVFNTRAYRGEGFMPALEDWQPWGMAGPAGEDWSVIAADYLKRIGDRLVPDESTVAVWEKLKKGNPTPESKLGAIVRYVQSSLTYKGLEFGTRAMVPSTVSKIQNDQYGDCKDHTLLLYRLLQRAGIVCYPALVDTGWKLHRDLPSLDQFNHMILYVPMASTQPWLDATDEWLDLTATMPDGLAGRQALVLDPQRPRLETIGQAAPARVRIDRVIQPGSGRDARVEETLTLTGAAASWARSWLLNYPESEHSGLIRRQLDSQGNFSLEQVGLKDAEDRSKPLILWMKYTVPGAQKEEGGPLQVPCFWECDYLAVSPVEDRQSPFLLSPAIAVESHTRFIGTWAGLTLPTPSAGEGKAIGTFWKIDWKAGSESGSGLRISVEVPHGQHPPVKWVEFQQARRDFVERLKRLEMKPS